MPGARAHKNGGGGGRFFLCDRAKGDRFKSRNSLLVTLVSLVGFAAFPGFQGE